MDQAIKEQWVTALRSGEYRQGKRYLHQSNEYCCLGVLCDLAVKAGVLTPERRTTAPIISYEEETSTLPESVSRWAGLTVPGGRAVVDNPSVDFAGGRISLAELNDEGHSFREIADVIERSF